MIRFAFLRSLIVLSAASVLTIACSSKNDSGPQVTTADSSAPHTGNPEIENQTQSLLPLPPQAGLQLYVTSDRLRVRSTPEVVSTNVAGVLEPNDIVEVVDPTRIGKEDFIAIKVLNSNADVPRNAVLYTSAKYLSASPREEDSNANPSNPATPQKPSTPSAGTVKTPSAAKIFVITNIATEKVRVYQRCEPGEGCVNKLLMEQDVVNGEGKDDTRTDVGVYRVSSWVKFYETLPDYPAWYKAGYPEVPAPGASHSAWYKSSYMPAGEGSMRGAFGWYTLKVEPNGNGQWMHGTAGWGADKKRFILRKETFAGRWADLWGSIRSHGCTRIDNESIAYLRSLVPIGATYVKIYAKEGTRVKTPVASGPETDSWSYIMTKVGGGVTNKHQLADRETVLAASTPNTEWIEEGTLNVDRYPNPVTFDRRKNKSEGGDLYALGERSFQGVFLVDEGTLVDYQHPSALRRGGYSDGVIPSYMISTDPNYFVPQAPRDSYDPATSGTYGS